MTDRANPSLAVWNPEIEWDLDTCPFIDCCDIRITSPMTAKDTESIHFNLGQLPKGIMRRLPKSATMKPLVPLNMTP